MRYAVQRGTADQPVTGGTRWILVPCWNGGHRPEVGGTAASKSRRRSEALTLGSVYIIRSFRLGGRTVLTLTTRHIGGSDQNGAAAPSHRAGSADDRTAR